MKMTRRFTSLAFLFRLTKWIFISGVIGALAGSASAMFLVSLNWATNWREGHRWIIGFLPIAGFIIGWIYHQFGSKVEAGNNLVIEEIHEPKETILVRMAPLIMVTTVMTHLFGGSAGREGTAIQMGGSLADRLTKPLRLNAADRRILLMAGMSAGFASVFGTPLAGAVFGLEVLVIGSLQYDAILPCFISAVVGDRVTLAYGIHHVAYVVPFVPTVTWSGIAQAVVAGMLFGLTGMLFVKITHGIGSVFKTKIAYGPLRPLIGGAIVAAAVWALHSTRYIGLGIPTISESFTGSVHSWDFLAKLIFTAVTLGSGFKGGEVTPLFFIGATLGNALAYFFRLPASVLAGMGFVAVFAGAANTPLSSTFLAIEFFGAPMGLYAGIACVMSYLCSGRSGIYGAQRIGRRKDTSPDSEAS